MKKKGITAFAAVLIFFAGINVGLFVAAIRANQNTANAHEERHTVISSIYEASVAGGSFTRLARYYALVGDDFTYELFWAEVELDRYRQTLDTFAYFGITGQEMELFNEVTDLRLQMLDIHREVVRLRREGYIQEAIELAHGPQLQSLGMPAGPMSDEARDLIFERTTQAAYRYRSQAELFGSLATVASILLILGGTAWLILVGKAGVPRRAEIFGVIIIILACANTFFSVRANLDAEDELDAYEQQHALINASYNAERGGEILTRMSRMFIITGNEAQYNSYHAELELDRFGSALDTFIFMNAESSEINTLVDILGRLTMLRQIEAQAILLRSFGYYEEAIAVAFGSDVSDLDEPLGLLGEQLRDMVNARTNAAISDAAHSQIVFAHAAILTSLLLVVLVFGKLHALRGARKKGAPGIIASLFKSISNAAIRTKLIASFTIVIVIFTAQVSITSYFDSQIHGLTTHNDEYLVARSDILWDYHLEFTEMRRHLRETFLSITWMNNANEADRLDAARRLSASYVRLTYLTESYKTSVEGDAVLPLTYEDSRIIIMTEIMSYVSMIYRTFGENFFLTCDMNVYYDSVADYADLAEVMLRILRELITVNRRTAGETIEYYQSISNRVTTASLVTALGLAALLAITMMKTITRRVKAMEAAADKIAQGDFESDLQYGDDEISVAYAKLTGAFTNLVNEINHVTDIGKQGNTSSRINEDRFHGGYRETAIAINTLLDTSEETLSALTEAKNAANQSALAKGAFLSNMSHEIRTPMNAIVGMAAIGKSTDSIERKDYALSKIEDASSLLIGIINNVLDMSKIESGKLELSPVNFDFEQMLQRIVNVITLRVEEKRQNFDIYIDENIPKVLFGDAQHIAQVITNLLGNAVKFTPDEGSVFLNAYLMNEVDGLCSLRVEVIDTGIGISPEQQRDLFQPFQQVESDTSRKFGGTGLGLSISKNIIEMMEGAIWVESSLDQGASFIFTIQIRRGEDSHELPDTALQQAKQLAEDSFSFSGKRILLAEDIDINREVLLELMVPTNITIDCAENGEQAVSMFSKSPDMYDAIFMDVQMPEVDGFEATRRIRELEHPKAKTIPIIAMTANVFREDVDRCLEAGMDAHIGKPLDYAQITEKLKKYLS